LERNTNASRVGLQVRLVDQALAAPSSYRLASEATRCTPGSTLPALAGGTLAVLFAGVAERLDAVMARR
jgi:hypothetical protein